MLEVWSSIASKYNSSTILYVEGVKGDPYSYSFNYTRDGRHIKICLAWEVKMVSIMEGKNEVRLRQISHSYYKKKEPGIDNIMKYIRARSVDIHVEIPETNVRLIARPKTWYRGLFQNKSHTAFSDRLVINVRPASFLQEINKELSLLCDMYPEQKITLRNDYEDAETLKFYLHFRVTELPIDKAEILKLLDTLTAIAKKM
ncbi:hypothetical protein [Chitinophaga sp. Cy-1792]|uniref:hypothetical protein n=1 Tax=Chitinophaga sp. Cy-1792 TaxID=2608339 RepID=UPI001420E9F6|nr:hypothetical protein [Chitinophaga sp. Cy-1792]NIG52227.1 hypothetical protein [Chitinophaga sp. Cy-1792]